MSSHVEEYFARTGKTLYRTNDEGVERSHKNLRRHERRFNLRQTKNLTGVTKMMSSHRSITFWNSLAHLRRKDRRKGYWGRSRRS